MAARRTLRGWLEYLDHADRELTAEELDRVLAMNSREYLRLILAATIQLQQATEHIEAMMATLDETLAARDPYYAALGARRGSRPAEPVEALERRRDGS